MKILILSQYFWPENFRINDLAQDFKKRGHNIEVLTGIPNYPSGKIFENYQENPDYYNEFHGIKVHRVKIRPRKDGGKFNLLLNYFSFFFKSIFFSISKLRKKKYDLIFTFGTSPVTISITSIILAKFTKSKTAVWVLDLWPEIVYELKVINNILLKTIFSKIMNIIYNSTDLILAQSNTFKNKIQTKVKDISKVKVLTQWPEDLVKETKNIENIFFKENFLNIVFTGNIGEAQNFDHIIDVANRTKELSVIWHIVGTGRYISKLREEREISDKVIFYGHRDKNEMNFFLEKADVLLLCLKDGQSINSTIPGKFQTYLLADKPLLASISGETAEMINKHNIGLVSNPGDEEKFLDNIKIFLKEKKENKLQVDNKQLREKFNKNKILDFLDLEIQSLIKKDFDYLNLISSTEEINFNNNFILSAINLAFLGYYGSGDLKVNKNYIFWPDGLFFKKIYKDTHTRKIPGREIISQLNIPEHIKKIHIIGNLSENGKKYLKEKFNNREIISSKIPYGEASYLCESIPKLQDDEITIINLPTPKQEQVASILAEKNLRFNIFCTGGAIGMLCGDEPPVPMKIYSLNLEFFWRLRFDTRRRIKRLFETFFYYILSELKGKYNKIKINEKS